MNGRLPVNPSAGSRPRAIDRRDRGVDARARGCSYGHRRATSRSRTPASAVLFNRRRAVANYVSILDGSVKSAARECSRMKRIRDKHPGNLLPR